MLPEIGSMCVQKKKFSFSFSIVFFVFWWEVKTNKVKTKWNIYIQIYTDIHNYIYYIYRAVYSLVLYIWKSSQLWWMTARWFEPHPLAGVVLISFYMSLFRTLKDRSSDWIISPNGAQTAAKSSQHQSYTQQQTHNK